eukprot:CAMPEP_0196579054 /NCGR_PEP_ID=MMETSP1081-20130531/16884_1 /TAXON_ID=36882 /ORGANISM="Pyramimonas amylifera, Strain CCMP720" /LENGTH=180 /DNA_ID=CAMNT_0041898497 /DNA_START=104 /DNA_END=643 /DNA_ORIENTATION=+
MLRLAGLKCARQVLAPVTEFAARGMSSAVVSGDKIDWDAVTSSIDSAAGKRELSNLRTIYLDIMSNMKPKGSVVIDWEDHKKASGQPELVAKYEEAFKKLQVPKYQGDDAAKVSAHFAELEKEATIASAASEKRIIELEAELAQAQNAMSKLETITIDEILEEDPKLKEEVQSAIRAGEW